MSLLWRRRRDLHQDQINAIEGLLPTGKYMLIGPPGSGKTSILLHRGQYLRLPPHQLANTKLITFTRTLREFISLSGDNRFPAELITTMRSFVDRFFSTYGVNPPAHVGNLVEANRTRAIAAIDLLDRHGRLVSYDALLVDEIQDLSFEELEFLNRLTDRLMLVGDDRQRVYEGGTTLELAGEICDQRIDLRHHFRISHDICSMADRILVQNDYALSEYCHYTGPTPTPPHSVGPCSRRAQIEALIASLDIQLDTYNEPGDLIGVVVRQRSDCDEVFEALEQIGKLSGRSQVFHSGVSNRHFSEECRICITTIQSCKGLEFRALHWLFAEDDAYLTRQKAYTVVTRAKTSLAVYFNNALPEILAGAFPPAAQGLFDDDE
ncbi:AAA family ATPase [Pseudorhizobium pelagicum]|uniref:AAA family ATPase n=1 Tax=Pseudorhizobium pelagicum TaxID=1509405 RepID=UPI0009DE4D11|nr:AAA family ATPase [Pseudorhizobium pelagicum]